MKGGGSAELERKSRGVDGGKLSTEFADAENCSLETSSANNTGENKNELEEDDLNVDFDNFLLGLGIFSISVESRILKSEDFLMALCKSFRFEIPMPPLEPFL